MDGILVCEIGRSRSKPSATHRFAVLDSALDNVLFHHDLKPAFMTSPVPHDSDPAPVSQVGGYPFTLDRALHCMSSGAGAVAGPLPIGDGPVQVLRRDAVLAVAPHKHGHRTALLRNGRVTSLPKRDLQGRTLSAMDFFTPGAELRVAPLTWRGLVDSEDIWLAASAVEAVIVGADGDGHVLLSNGVECSPHPGLRAPQIEQDLMVGGDDVWTNAPSMRDVSLLGRPLRRSSAGVMQVAMRRGAIFGTASWMEESYPERPGVVVMDNGFRMVTDEPRFEAFHRWSEAGMAHPFYADCRDRHGDVCSFDDGRLSVAVPNGDGSTDVECAGGRAVFKLACEAHGGLGNAGRGLTFAVPTLGGTGELRLRPDACLGVAQGGDAPARICTGRWFPTPVGMAFDEFVADWGAALDQAAEPPQPDDGGDPAP